MWRRLNHQKNHEAIATELVKCNRRLESLARMESFPGLRFFAVLAGEGRGYEPMWLLEEATSHHDEVAHAERTSWKRGEGAANIQDTQVDSEEAHGFEKLSNLGL